MRPNQTDALSIYRAPCPLSSKHPRPATPGRKTNDADRICQTG
jgi:hypothetical protein